ncbi:MAG: ssuB 1 [Burkholderiaceae bacterium]|nr:ssuB 1 [Burkholderiaceae bacterium]
MTHTKIRVSGVSVSYQDRDGQQHVPLQLVNLSVRKGELICLLGPSGCGKTTLLNLMAGFQTPSSGSIEIDGVAVRKPNPRHVTLFQEYGLFPWRTVLDNVLFGLEAQKIARDEALRRAHAILATVGLTDSARRFPRQLSGGMKQRVALARALVVEPDVLFMDEPFAALDTFTRHRLQDEIRTIRQRLGTTVVFVTHDFDEAAYLADRVAVMSINPGRIAEMVEFAPDTTFDRRSRIFEERRIHVFTSVANTFGHAEPTVCKTSSPPQNASPKPALEASFTAS